MRVVDTRRGAVFVEKFAKLNKQYPQKILLLLTIAKKTSKGWAKISDWWCLSINSIKTFFIYLSLVTKNNSNEVMEEIRNQMAPILLYSIKQKLNPCYANRNGFEHKVYCSGISCSVEQFKALFPQAKSFPVRKNPVTKLPKLQSSKKLYEANFSAIRSLDYLFKSFDDEWDVIFNDEEIGYAYKISFRLIRSTINSLRRKLENGIAGDIEYYKSMSNTTISCTIHRELH